MAVTSNQHGERPETTHSTKRVFIRAEHNDDIRISDTISRFADVDIPDIATVIKRDMTYYGPRLRIEGNNNEKQYLLTAPGPEKEAILWDQSNASWREVAEVSLEFEGSLPQYEICPHCNEPLSTVAHRRRSAIGACK